MVWEKGKGIVYYMHGNGQKNMHVEFGTDLKKQQKEAAEPVNNAFAQALAGIKLD